MSRLARATLLGISVIAIPPLMSGCSLFRNHPDIAPVQPADPGEAADPENDEVRCIVSGKPIPPDERLYRYVYQGKTYYCATEAALELFRADPEKYL